MNYFKRLADRSGPSVSPRGAVTPMARPAAISPGDQLEAGDQPPPPETSLAETAAFDAPATIVLAAPGPPSAIGPAAAAPTLFEPMATMRATASEGRLPTQQHIIEPGAPAHRIERETVSPAPPEWKALLPDTQLQGSPHNRQPVAPLDPRTIDPEPPSAARQIVSDVSPSRMDGETVSNFHALSSPVAAVEPAIRAADIEVPQRAETPTASKVGAGAEHAAVHTASRLRPAQLPESDEDIAIPVPVPALRQPPAAGRSREDRDATAPRHDRTATATSRAHAGHGTRDASVEVRIGVVTLQVHAPAAPAALQAPRYSFAPHRHYLRTW
jgi:hypothetical protein